MNAQTIKVGIRALIATVVVVGAGWAAYTYLYLGAIVINGNNQKTTTTITNSQNQQVAKGTDSSFRLAPGTYTVAVEGETSGISKQVNIGSLSTTTIALTSATMLQTTPIAHVAMFGAFASGDSIIGLDPKDMHVKRIDRLGTVTDQLTSGQVADQNDWEPELPNEVQSYQLYQHGQALVASDGKLYVLGSSAIKAIHTEGIVIDTTTAHAPQFIIAAQPGTASFVVAYNRDVFWYENPQSMPKKIYTAQKTFDAVSYGDGRIALYFASMPDSRQDLRSQFNNYMIDPTFIDVAHGNQTQSVPGPVTHIALNPNGQLAVVHPRHQQSYLYDLQKQQNLTYVDAPLIALPVWTNNTTYIYSKQNHVWQYETTSKQSTLLGNVAFDATSLSGDETGNYIVSAYDGQGQMAVFRLGKAISTVPSTQIDLLNEILPYNNGLYSITFSNVSGPIITIQTMAPLNDTSHLAQYKEETLQRRQLALDYLTKHDVDLSKVTILYDPADPLQ